MNPRPARRPGSVATAIALFIAMAVASSGAVTVPADCAVERDLRTVAFSTARGTLDADRLRGLVGPALVTIVAQLPRQHAVGAGTGIVLSATGEVLTNYHVIAGASTVRATVGGIGQSYPATVVGVDRQQDVAVLRLRGASGLRSATLGDSATVRPGQQVAAIGDSDGPGSKLTVATGSVKGLQRAIKTRRDEVTGRVERLTGLIEVTADVRQGDSGGPVVDSAGRVLAVTVAATVEAGGDEPGGTGFAIPINTAVASARKISQRSRR